MKAKLESLLQVGGRLAKECRRLRFTALVSGALVVATGHALASTSTTPDAAKFVASIGEEVVTVLSATGVDQSEKRRHFRDIFTHALDLDMMARRALGRHWRRATDEQKDDYVRLFRDYIVRIYAVQLADYDGESFSVLRQQPSSGTGTVMRPNTVEHYAKEAGFRQVEGLPIDHFFFRFYRRH